MRERMGWGGGGLVSGSFFVFFGVFRMLGGKLGYCVKMEG